ncbi:MAG: TIGR03067 domain-containing protein [Verrucomicrobiota bacterium]
MKRITAWLGAGIVFIGLGGLWGAAPGAKPVTPKALQGVWSGARFDSGKGEDAQKGVKLQLTFEGNQVKGVRLPQGNIGEGEFTLAADGKTIDATGVSSNFKGNTYQGIIKIEGDTLYWCTTVGGGKLQKRPEDFSANPAQRTYLIVVKRQK